ncbi:hypothetical protein GFS24_09385 [Chitinophaga sp. SYP-B3965]|uniref:hypothetical protein n=1 Tax=Chitinophaga sp. SYP-B3965 TaxID=2663120 RepID=UPI001299CE15|nr:hypothetical protein [Chitinophaga sp. SYP-B3965]MRG45328.1 hypothetical protein [Chitinophaga sp. SYP-B3965]
MEIYISEDATIAGIQLEFRDVYPFLALEFYRQPHEPGEASPPGEKLPPETAIDDIRIMHPFGWVDIDGSRTAAEVEYDFRHIIGLNVQVLRRSGGLWLATTQTDSWTLQQLNESGKRAEKEIFQFPEERVEED